MYRETHIILVRLLRLEGFKWLSFEPCKVGPVCTGDLTQDAADTGRRGPEDFCFGHAAHLGLR